MRDLERDLGSTSHHCGALIVERERQATVQEVRIRLLSVRLYVQFAAGAE
jgi:hypothetical protein